MSKVDELKLKYQNVLTRTFNKFVESDKTPTKKYLEFLLKSWSNRGINDCPQTTDALIELVLKFDELLPYIEFKDIYSKDYNSLSLLKLTVVRAEEIKDEKTFVRDEHVVVLHETDEYMFLSPLTHRGSLKYGANTRWCTASRAEPQTFTRYSRGGLLGYIIDKKGDKQTNYNKFALYHEYNENPFSGEILVYNAYDNEVSDASLINGGWTEEQLQTIFWYYRAYFVHMKKTKKSKDFVDKFTSTLGSLDFNTLLQHIVVLEQTRNTAYISSLEETINNLYKNLNNEEYARFTKAQN
jgi:hypothetical protein